MMAQSIYKEFRADGWPLCPQCEEDELYSLKMMVYVGKGEKPTLADCLSGEMRCYRCNWSSKHAQIRALLDRARQSRQPAPLMPAPRYDDVYFKAMAVMDSE